MYKSVIPETSIIVNDVEDLISHVDINDYSVTDTSKRKYVNTIIAYDSETVKVIDKDGVVKSTQVCHQIAVDDKCMIVRTVDEIMTIFETIRLRLTTPPVKGKKKNIKAGTRVIIYIHNEHFDMMFLLYKMLEGITECFDVKGKFNRVIWKDTVEFRDSLSLTGESLSNSIKTYVSDTNIFKTKDWDYDKIRSPLSELDPEEVDYALMDVISLVEVIRGVMRMKDVTLANLPISKTSFVKRALQESCLGPSSFRFNRNGRRKRFQDFMSTLTLTLKQLYMFKDSYFGGVSDTSPLYCDELVENIDDYDIGSEYPRQLVAKEFPVSSPIWDNERKYCSRKGLTNLVLEGKGFTARLVFHDIKIKRNMSIPNLINYDQKNVNNIEIFKYELSGSRVYYAERLEITLNDVDFRIVEMLYDYERIEVKELMYYDMGRLPRSFVKCVLEAYADKTKLKGLDDEDSKRKYTFSKIFVNSIYGLCAMFPIHEKRTLNEKGMLIKQNLSIEDQIEILDKHNKNKNRVTYYPWGVYVASYGHLALYEGIRIVKKHLIACDTDSVKFINDNHKYDKEFEELNKAIKHENNTAAYDLDIDKKMFAPCTKDGVCKPIGFWEKDDRDKMKDEDGNTIFEGQLHSIIAKRPKCYLKIFIDDKTGTKFYKSTTSGINSKGLTKAFDFLISIGKVKSLDEVIEKKLVDIDKIIIYDDDIEEIKQQKKRRIEWITKHIGKFNSYEECFIANIDIFEDYTNKMCALQVFDQPEFEFKDCDGNWYTADNPTAIILKPVGFAFNEKTYTDNVIDLINGDGPDILADSIMDFIV